MEFVQISRPTILAKIVSTSKQEVVGLNPTHERLHVGFVYPGAFENTDIAKGKNPRIQFYCMLSVNKQMIKGNLLIF